jgi:hypothetical protein
MVSRSRYSLWALSLAAALVAASASAQQLVRVRDIRANPLGYSNVQVTVEGYVMQYTEGKGTTNFYILKDDFGDPVKVRTTRERPVTNVVRYRVSGPVGIDVVNRNDVYISEESRVEVRPPATAAPAAVPLLPPPPPPPAVPWELIAAILVVLAILVALLVWVARSRRGATGEPGLTDLDSAPPTAAAPPQVIEGGTIKMFAPPPGTLKILPGRFSVASGDEVVKEIRFYKVKGQSTPELTFGRAPGAPFTHIQLKPMTVSSRQAKLTFINNQWILTNFAPESSNPTKYNGRDLPVDGQVALQEGDRVEMGEVQLIFHAT